MRSITICCFPLNVDGNNHLEVLYEALKRQGAELIQYDWLWSNFRKYDAFHVHWPDAVVMGKSWFKAVLKLILFMASVLITRLRGIPIVYNVHNIGAHDGHFPVLERILWRLFTPSVTTFVHMNTQSQKDFVAWQPRSRKGTHVVIPLPHFGKREVDLPSKCEARGALGISQSSFVYLSFGLLRPYKGIETLIEAFSSLPNTDITLLIAGAPFDADYGAFIESLCKNDPRVRLYLKFISEDELDLLLASSDIVVLAHKKLNNSGVALRALTSARPILAPDRGAITDLANLTNGHWVTTFHDVLSPASLQEARALASEGEPDSPPNLTQLDPDLIGERLLKLFQQVKRPRAA